jgi:phage terminase large subunit-like protein
MALDLSSKQDISALILLFPLYDESFVTLQRFYLPEKVAELQGNEHYRTWAQQGKIILTDGNMIDHQQIKDDIDMLRKKFQVDEIIFDPSQAAWMMGTLLLDGAPVLEITQNATNCSEAMKQVAGLIDEGKLLHNSKENDPMTWQLSNVVNKANKKDQDFPDKERPELKIDGPVALIFAMSRCLFDEETSMYETERIESW